MLRFGATLLLATAIADCCNPAFAEEFASKTGKFVKEGANWIEYPPYDGVHHATFAELSRTNRVVMLYDPTRNMVLRLPFAGGMGQWTDAEQSEWAGLAALVYRP